MKRKTSILITILLVLTFSCRLEYIQSKDQDQVSRNIPDTILYEFEHISVSGGRPVFSIKADEAETYDQQKKTILKSVSFIEYDDQLEALTTGTADNAILYTDTENAELTGNIEAWSARDDAEIQTNYLFWNNEERTLTSKEEEVVTVTQENGTTISGKGFKANMRTMNINFSGGADGSFILEEDK